jgi:exopolysaccharide biosynthesis polyprenyl glycosylphosphotransferase
MDDTDAQGGDSYASQVEREMIRRLGQIGDSVTSDVLRSRYRDYAVTTLTADPPTGLRPRPAHRRNRWPGVLVTVDALSALIATFVASPLGSLWPAVWVFPVVWLGATATYQLYQRRHYGRGNDEYRRLARATLAATTGVSFACALILHNDLYAHAALRVLPVAGALSVVTRRLLRGVGGRVSGGRPTLLVGTAEQVTELSEALRRSGSELRPIAACITEESRDTPVESYWQVPPIGNLDDVLSGSRFNALVGATGCEAVVVLPGPQVTAATMGHIGWRLANQGISLFLAPLLRETASDRLSVHVSGSVSLLHVKKPTTTRVVRLPKEIIERSLAAIGVVLLAPVWIAISLAILIGDGRPVLFRHKRVGLGGKPFIMYKFRTMKNKSRKSENLALSLLRADDGPLFKARRDPRVTRVGAVLRRYSLDELPQLINVVKGTMSLVGPRPPLPEEAAQYTEEIERRLLVKPGLTGLWQISGRSDLAWAEAVRLDLSYVENWSYRLDAEILLRTVTAALRGTGAY